VKLDPEVIVTEFVAQFPDSPVTHGYPPAEREAAEKVADTAAAGHSTRIRLNQSGNWTRVASVVVLAIVLAGVMTFAAPRRWAQWDTLRSWATSVSVPANPLADFMSAETPIKTLDARPLKPLHSSGPRTLPSRRVPPPTIVAVNTSPAPVATASKSESIAPAPAPAPAPADAGAIANEPLRMTLLANSASWVIVWVDGRKTINKLLDVGEQERLEATRELIVTAGDGGAIMMTLNEAVTRSLGRTGKTVTVQVNHANLPKYLGRDESASVKLAQ
jgi:hypothetical protein